MPVLPITIDDSPLFTENVAINKNQTSDSMNELANQFDAFFLQSSLKSENLEKHFINKSNSAMFVASSVPINNYINVDSPSLVTELPSVEEPLEFAEIKDNLSMTEAMQQFISTLLPYAKEAANLLGVDPNILISQAALETGWGKHIAKDSDGNSTNNLFNIKAVHKANSAEVATTEFINHKPVKVTASFKKYSTLSESFQDYVSLITNNHRYQEALSNADDPKRYLESLQQAGYATDPEYANKIWGIYEGLRC